MAGNDSYASQDHNSLKSPLQLSGSPGRYPMSVMSEDNLSNGGSDLEDDGVEVNPDIERSDSPEAPLSLITTKKNHNDSDDRPEESPKPPDIIKVNTRANWFSFNPADL